MADLADKSYGCFRTGGRKYFSIHQVDDLKVELEAYPLRMRHFSMLDWFRLVFKAVEVDR